MKEPVPTLDITDTRTWPALMTTSEVALILRVTEPTVRRLVLEGVLPSPELGRSVRISRTDLMRHLRLAEESQ